MRRQRDADPGSHADANADPGSHADANTESRLRPWDEYLRHHVPVG